VNGHSPQPYAPLFHVRESLQRIKTTISQLVMIALTSNRYHDRKWHARPIAMSLDTIAVAKLVEAKDFEFQAQL
jgi:hypothetical protein